MPQTVSQLPRSILGGAQVTKSVFIPLVTLATTGSVVCDSSGVSESPR